MDYLSIMNDFTALSIISVAIFATFKSMEKYPSAPFGGVYIYCGFFLVLLDRAFFSYIAVGNAFLTFISMILHFIGLGAIITGGLKFKIKYYRPLPLLLIISTLGLVTAYFSCFVIKDVEFIKKVYFFSFSFTLFALGVAFLLRPKMEKTGGYILSAISLFMLSAYYGFYASGTGKQFLATAPFEFMILALFVVGLILINGNILWFQMEFLISDVKKSKERLKVIIQASPFPIVISKLRDDTLLLINDKAGETFGIDKEHPEKYKTENFFASKENKKEFLDALENNSELENFEVALKKTNSTETFWMLASSRVIDFEQEIVIYSAFQDISDIKEKEIKLFDQATRDPLTNCYNRRQFEELANKEVFKTMRSNSPFTVVMIDADHFKKVNDTYGHATGDIVLKELANCCRNTLRETDIVARFGGEEFVLLLPETTADLAYPVCDRLREKISELDVIGVNGEVVKFTVSMGLAESTTGEEISDIVEVADAALYIAKETGRNRLVIGEKGMNVSNTEPVASKATDESFFNIEGDADDDYDDSADFDHEPVSDIPLTEEEFVKPKSIWDDN